MARVSGQRPGRRVSGLPGRGHGGPGWVAAVVLGVVLLAGSTAWAGSTSALPAGNARAATTATVPVAPATAAVSGQRIAATPAPVRAPEPTALPATEAPAEQPPTKPLIGAGRHAGAWRWPLPAGSPLLAGFDPPAQPWLAGHRGVDLLAEPAAPVHAVAGGVVQWVGVIAGIGSVSVLHDGGIRSTYQPLDAVVTQGERVVAGQLLGWLTPEGSHCALRACLHLGALIGRVYLDPALLLGDRAARLLPLPLPALGQS